MSYKPFIRAITPTLNRHSFLSKQFEQFDVINRNYCGESEWVIVDTTPIPHPHFVHMNDSRIIYIHLPSLDRAFLAKTLIPQYPELSGSFLVDSESAFAEYQRLLLRKKKEPDLYPPEIKAIPSWNNISLGEQRNIAIRIQTRNQKPDIVVQLDDDDYYAAGYFNWVSDHIKNAGLIRHGHIPMYLEDSAQWVVCEFQSTESTKIISTNGNLIKEIPPESVASLQAEGKMSRDGFGFGLAMAFKMAALEEVMRVRDQQGPFPSISLYEDAILARRIARLGYRISFPADDNYMLCRIMHTSNHDGTQSNISKKTRMHRILSPECILTRYPDMAKGVERMLRSRNPKPLP